MSNKRLSIRFIGILAIIIPLYVMGNETLHPKSMEYMALDKSAKECPRKDLNGNECALVKLVLTLPDIHIEGNLIGEVQCNNEEYWVYLKEGSKMIKIKHNNYPPIMINFNSFGINQLQSGCTYTLIVEIENNDDVNKDNYEKQIEDLQKLLYLASENDDEKFSRAMETKNIDLMVSLAESGFVKAYLPLANLYKEKANLNDFEKWNNSNPMKSAEKNNRLKDLDDIEKWARKAFEEVVDDKTNAELILQEVMRTRKTFITSQESEKTRKQSMLNKIFSHKTEYKTTD